MQPAPASREGAPSALRAEQILDDIADGYLALDRSWRIMYANRAAEQVLDRSRTELIGHEILRCAGQFGSLLEAQGRRVLDEGQTVTFEAYIDPLGLWFEVRICPSPLGLSVYFQDIAQRKQMREALESTQELYRLVALVTDDALYDWDLRRHTLSWSESIQHAFGYRRDDVAGDLNWWEARIHPDDRGRVSDSLNVALRGTAENWSEEYRFRRRDLSYASVMDRACIIRDEAGLAVRMVGAMIDITRLKQAEQKLEERNRFLQKLVATVPSLIMTLDARGRVVQFNRACEQLTGFRRGEVIGRDVAEMLLEPEAAADLRRRLADPYAASVGGAHEVDWRLKSGEHRLIAWQWTPLHTPDGLAVYMLGTGMDITEQRRAEEALRQSRDELEQRVEERTHRLQEANEQLRQEFAERSRRELELHTVTSHARCILWHADVEGLPGWPDPAPEGPMAERFVWRATVPDPEAAGRILPLDIRPGETYAEAWAQSRVTEDAAHAHARAADALRRGLNSYSQEFRCTDRDGQIHWLFEDVYLASIGPGRWHAVGVCTDVTERKRIEEERERHVREQTARIEAEAANRAKDQFLAVLSHELRTPLNPVLLTATALLEDAHLPEALREDVEMIRRNVELQTKLIDDLLDLTRISRGKLDFHFRTEDLHQLIGSATRVCQSDIDGKRIRLTMALSATRHFVRADGAHLQQALWNLLKNALKFTPAGGEIMIRTVDGDDQTVRVEVVDTGIGISPESLPKIFLPFGQADETVTKRFGGLGLGLTVAKEVAEAHGGSISAISSGPGHGATFVVVLPTVEAPQAERAAPRPPDADPIRWPLRILLVEDHEDTLQFMVRFLRSRGHEVTSTRSVGAALEAAGMGRFDLLISDIGLPDGSGIELMQQLREHFDWPAIALSGYGMEEDVRRSQAAGFVRHLIKPVDARLLEQAIRDAAQQIQVPTPDR